MFEFLCFKPNMKSVRNIKVNKMVFEFNHRKN